MSDEADQEELAFSERIFKNIEARTDLERRTKELLRGVALDCEEMPPRPAGCDCLACRARALLAEWEARRCA